MRERKRPHIIMPYVWCLLWPGVFIAWSFRLVAHKDDDDNDDDGEDGRGGGGGIEKRAQTPRGIRLSYMTLMMCIYIVE